METTQLTFSRPTSMYVPTSHSIAIRSETVRSSIAHDLDFSVIDERCNLRMALFYMGVCSWFASLMALGLNILGKSIKVSTNQLMLYRSIIQTLCCLIYINYNGATDGFFGLKEYRLLLVMRGVFGFLGAWTVVLAYTKLNLGIAVPVVFTAPFMMNILAVIILKEKFKFINIVGASFGILGVLIICKPQILFNINSIQSEIIWNIGIVAALLSALFSSIGNILVRKVGTKIDFIYGVIYFSITPIIPTFLLTLYNQDFVMIFDIRTNLLILITCLSGFFTHIYLAKSLKYGTINKTSCVMFLQVIFAYLNDWLFSGINPSKFTILGAFLIGISMLLSQ